MPENKQIAFLVFPHQLFEDNPGLEKGKTVYIVEETLFFNQFKFHKQKLAFHRASMKFYEDHLKKKKYTVEYIESTNKLCDTRKLIPHLKKAGFKEVHYIELIDNWLEKRLQSAAKKAKLETDTFETPMFLNDTHDLNKYFGKKKTYRQTGFYTHLRRKLDILVTKDKKPTGGEWTYDKDNREKFPEGKKAPKLKFPAENSFYKEARKYVEKHFPKNYGSLDTKINYPVTFSQSKAWLKTFLKNRLKEFGPYQDAIVKDESFLFHSILSPMLNAGLLTPAQVMDETLAYAGKHKIPINSLEGFTRQLIGWREFIRALYEREGSPQRTHNFFKFKKKIPNSFWQAKTGIDPVDQTIIKVLETGYCHHIERLMVLGNFMLLCEFDPDEVYKWFMELFIDAYDWVMVPNVYGMSQFADGGLMATKPYISSSNYIMNMSNYEKGDWQDVWDGLFWRFMDKHRSKMKNNPRLAMLLKNFDKMPKEKQQDLIKTANQFLKSI